MRDLKELLKNRKIEYNKLLKYGFILKNDTYIYEKNILNDFKVVIEINKNKQISKVIDLIENDDYILVDVKSSTGRFVGNIRDEYEKILKYIINNCTTMDVFKNKQTKEVINYVKEKYKDDVEYLWDKFPNNAIVRSKYNKKWYIVILTINENKLQLDKDKEIEIIDLRYDKNKINDVIDNIKIFPGYHMNKQSWITIKLDESIDIKEIYKLIDNSYMLITKNKERNRNG